MEKNEIIRAYGSDCKAITKHVLEAAELEAELLEKMEGMGIDRTDLRIGIKPNVLGRCPAEFGATTHTGIVAGIIEYLQERGFSGISVLEGSWVGDKTAEAYELLGWNALAKEYGVELTDNQKEKGFEADCSGLKLNICESFNRVDYLINVPVLKGHCQTKMTCALKNMKGMLPNSEKRRFHSMGLHRPIAHLNTYIHQDFIVVDHICGDPDFEEGGNPLVRNCVMAAKDPVLTDAFGASLLGYKPYDVEYIRLAEELGVGSADLSELKVITVEGEGFEDMPRSRKILEVNYAVADVDSCSACYGMLIGALNRLKDEGTPYNSEEKICIGQGYRGKTGKFGIGSCTAKFDFNVPGCPPEEEEIYRALKMQNSK